MCVRLIDVDRTARPSVVMQMMNVRRVGMAVPRRFVPMRMAVCAVRHHVMVMVVMAVVVSVCMLVLHRVVLVLMVM